MGFRGRWIAIKGVSEDEILPQLGLVSLQRDMPAADRPGFSCAASPGNWLIVLVEREELPRSAARMDELSRGREVLAFELVESVNYSEGAGWRDGVRQWRIVHDLEKNQELEVEGEPPPEFAAIRERLSREQTSDEDADYLLDVPSELSLALCGFREGMDSPETFRALERVDGRRESRGLWGLVRAAFGLD